MTPNRCPLTITASEPPAGAFDSGACTAFFMPYSARLEISIIYISPAFVIN
jgi:hypothetical protein